MAKRPYNFSWFVPEVLAGMGYPRAKGNLEFLKEKKIEVLINYHDKDESSYFDDPKKFGISVIKMYIKDWGAPSLEQMIEVNKIIASNKAEGRAVGMHCSAGSGRTGTMLAAFLLYEDRNITADEAIEEARKRRKKNKDNKDGDEDNEEDDDEEDEDDDDEEDDATNAIEVVCQEEALDTYWFYLKKEEEKMNEGTQAMFVPLEIAEEYQKAKESKFKEYNDKINRANKAVKQKIYERIRKEAHEFAKEFQKLEKIDKMNL